MSTSAASATTPSSRMWRTSSATASSTASWISSTVRRRVLDDDDLVAALGEVVERGRERVAIGVRARGACAGRGSRRVGPTICRRTDGAIGSPRRSTASSVSSTVFPCSSASIKHRRRPAQDSVHDEGRRIADEHAALAQLSGHVPRGGERDVVGQRRANELDEREHGDRVEEVHPDDALGMLEVGAHLRDRERRRVRREHALG